VADAENVSGGSGAALRQAVLASTRRPGDGRQGGKDVSESLLVVPGHEAITSAATFSATPGLRLEVPCRHDVDPRIKQCAQVVLKSMAHHSSTEWPAQPRRRGGSAQRHRQLKPRGGNQAPRPVACAPRQETGGAVSRRWH